MTDAKKTEFDVVVVGSGGAGLVAALVAAYAGLSVVVVEKEPRWGGTTAWSGGGLWIPDNHLMARDAAGDSVVRARAYMDTVIDYDGAASSPDRRSAFLQSAREMALWLDHLGVDWVRARRYPDYYPEKLGGMVGRSLEAQVFNARRLGSWRRTMSRPPGMPYLALTTRDVEALPQALRTWRGLLGAVAVLARTVGWYATGRLPLGLGRALVGRLMCLLIARGADIRLETAMVGLQADSDRVTGVEVRDASGQQSLKARLGVVLTAGGFARNAEFRRRHQPVDDKWTSASPGDQGDAIMAAQRLGAAVELMDEAWWGPSSLPPGGWPAFSVYERSMPGAILVDQHGRRFVNESTSYVDVGHAMLGLNPGGAPPPTWLILDGRHRRRYLFGMTPPGVTPSSWRKSEYMKRAGSLEALAVECRIDPQGLLTTIERFNGFARTGKDLDFGRGDSAYDRYYGDPSVKPNPNLGPIDRGPFYAVRMGPGDLGTKGGLVTDPDGRVLMPEGLPIGGLYAAGNTTASVMGRTYPGAGATLGPALTFAYRAARHILSMRSSL